MIVVDDDARPSARRAPTRSAYIARIGHVPLGYYKDEEKTARTFPTRADGTRGRCSATWATVDADGTIVFLGRGSQCINTGGEKVFAEEVEAALHGHPAIADVLVVAVPDERIGERVAAVVGPPRTGREPTARRRPATLPRDAGRLQGPARLVVVDEVKRTPAGKADYRWAKAVASEHAPHPA